MIVVRLNEGEEREIFECCQVTDFDAGGSKICPGLIVEIVLSNNADRFVQSKNVLSGLIIGTVE